MTVNSLFFFRFESFVSFWVFSFYFKKKSLVYELLQKELQIKFKQLPVHDSNLFNDFFQYSWFSHDTLDNYRTTRTLIGDDKTYLTLKNTTYFSTSSDDDWFFYLFYFYLRKNKIIQIFVVDFLIKLFFFFNLIYSPPFLAKRRFWQGSKFLHDKKNCFNIRICFNSIIRKYY